MDAFHHGIGGHDKIKTIADLDHSAIIANTNRHVRASTAGLAETLSNQFKFVHKKADFRRLSINLAAVV